MIKKYLEAGKIAHGWILDNDKKIDEVINSLKGIDCNFKGTSCPDQLARALESIKENR